MSEPAGAPAGPGAAADRPGRPGAPGVPVPPDDPEEWSDEEWISYLEATAEDAGAQEDRAPASAIARFARTPGGTFLGAAMSAVGDIIYGPKEIPTAVQPAARQPHDDDEIEVELDPDSYVTRVRHHGHRGDDSATHDA